MMNFRIDLKEEKKWEDESLPRRLQILVTKKKKDCRYEDNPGNIIIGEENQEKLSLKTN